MLHVEVSGAGPDLVLVHGWGMHGGVWADWASELSGRFRVWAVDLPGHGNSRWQQQETLGAWAAAVQEVVPVDAWWLGWSLGGLVSLAALADRSARVKGVVLLASTPAFVTRESWPHAVDAQLFGQFAAQLENDIDRTLARFLALQVRGAKRSGETLRKLRTAFRDRPQPAVAALQRGLHFLQASDLRSSLQSPAAPVRWLLGERDTLVPAEVCECFPAIPSRRIAAAGHAPFLSHPEPCSAQLDEWLLDKQEQVPHANG